MDKLVSLNFLHDVLHMHSHMHACMHAYIRKVHQHIMTSMCGYWIVMVITATTKSRMLATICMLTEHYDYLLAYISTLMMFKKCF